MNAPVTPPPIGTQIAALRATGDRTPTPQQIKNGTNPDQEKCRQRHSAEHPAWQSRPGIEHQIATEYTEDRAARTDQRCGLVCINKTLNHTPHGAAHQNKQEIPAVAERILDQIPELPQEHHRQKSLEPSPRAGTDR